MKYLLQNNNCQLWSPSKKELGLSTKRVSLIFKKIGSDDERNGSTCFARTNPPTLRHCCPMSTVDSNLKTESNGLNHHGVPANISAMSWQTKEDVSLDQSSDRSRPRRTVLLLLLLLLLLQLLLLLWLFGQQKLRNNSDKISPKGFSEKFANLIWYKTKLRDKNVFYKWKKYEDQDFTNPNF